VPVLESFAALTEGSGHTGKLDGPGFLATLMHWVLEEFAGAFERLEEQLEELDQRAMRGKGSIEDEIDGLVQLRRHAAELRRALVAHRSTLLALAQPELEALGDEQSAERFRMLLDRHAETVQLARDARESIVSSFDVLIARTGHRTNEIVKLLTLVSVIFLPGAVIAGVMGMNFDVPLFEHVVGFWLVIGLIAAIGVATLTVARLRDWI
jgi:magnesium transporter